MTSPSRFCPRRWPAISIASPRFAREARALAALNHPRIATLHGMEDSTGRPFLVMELVEGETLAERLQRGALPLDQALRLALQIVEALEAAHEKGIVHRDLKPANVKITGDDTIKVLDFGLAKAMDEGSADDRPALTHSPTLSMLATQAGAILGTAAYMSPEQAKGLPVDHRSDVFSFGIVLYEMLAGRQPFSGDTAPDVMASILAREPDLDALPAGLNPRLAESIARCLQKNPKKRWQAAGDLRLELEKIAAAPRALPAGAPTVSRSSRIPPLAAAAIVSAAFTSAVWWYGRPQQRPGSVTRFSVRLDEGQQFTNNGQQLLTISHDGDRIAYFTSGRLFVRAMSELEARPLTPAATADSPLTGAPLFSPNGHASGSWPLWSANDKELTVRLSPPTMAIGGLQIMSVSTQPTLTVGNPEVMPVTGAFLGGASNPRNYDRMPDGKRFLFVAQPGGPGGQTAPQIHVVTNWLTELQQRVPTR